MEMPENYVHLNTECQALLESRFSGNEVCAFMADWQKTESLRKYFVA